MQPDELDGYLTDEQRELLLRATEKLKRCQDGGTLRDFVRDAVVVDDEVEQIVLQAELIDALVEGDR